MADFRLHISDELNEELKKKSEELGITKNELIRSMIMDKTGCKTMQTGRKNELKTGKKIQKELEENNRLLGDIYAALCIRQSNGSEDEELLYQEVLQGLLDNLDALSGIRKGIRKKGKDGE